MESLHITHEFTTNIVKFVLGIVALTLLIPIRLYFGRNKPQVMFETPDGAYWVRTKTLGTHADYAGVTRTWYGKWTLNGFQMRNYGGTRVSRVK